jgi:hypothetical protein
MRRRLPASASDASREAVKYRESGGGRQVTISGRWYKTETHRVLCWAKLLQIEAFD